MSKVFIWVAAMLLAAIVPLRAADFPDWAYPAVPPHIPDPSPELRQVPDSPLRFTQGQIDSGYEVADWYPDEHPPMPRIVSNGAQPPVRACAMCHLPNGAGHPETGGLAGQPAGYAMQQMLDMRAGLRRGSRAASMLPIVRAATDEQLREASDYFASLPPVQWIRVVETEMVPRTVLGLGAVRYRAPEGGMEPLGRRVIEVPEDDARAGLRDGHSGFVAFVPPGSIERGRALVAAPADAGMCASCHGADLKGAGDIPSTAGRSVLSTFRALNDFRLGNRTGPTAAQMRAVVAGYSQDDMIAISAYLGTLDP